MSETDYATLEDRRRPQDRTTMQILYGMHAVAPFTLWSVSLLALIFNYVKRADEIEPRYRAHHDYMVRTFWWTLLWLVVTAPLWFLLVVPGAVAYTAIGAWYIYRYLRGWLRFNDNRFPQ
jgi:uncharacterized membrane protein